MGYDCLWMLKLSAHACAFAIPEVRKDAAREVPFQTVVDILLIIEFLTIQCPLQHDSMLGQPHCPPSSGPSRKHPPLRPVKGGTMTSVS